MASGRARLAELNRDYGAAEILYQSALTLHSHTDLPVEHCETLLAYGGFLRQAEQVARARPVLWTFQNTRVVSSGGIAGTLLGRWATFAETDQTPAGATVM